MKKSTLITTIAMIVVVVVALSTATYAWFTTSRQSVATTTITVQSSSDWTIQKGTVSSGNVTFAAGGDTITFDASLASDVYAPNIAEAISVKPSSDAGTGVTVGSTSWMTAKEKTVNETLQYYGTAYKTVYPDVIRVINSKSINPEGNATDAKALKLTIVVNMGSAPTEATKYAANALTFYVAKTGSENNVFTNGYKRVTNAITAIDTTFGDTVAAGANPGAGVTVSAAQVTLEGQGQSGSLTKPDYAGSDPAYFQQQTGVADDTLGLGVGDYYIAYTMTIGTVRYQQGINLAIYTWIDGYTISDISLGSSLTINYAFSNVA